MREPLQRIQNMRVDQKIVDRTQNRPINRKTHTGKKEILEGQLVQPGQTMVDIVDSSDLWVIANYRETQLSNIREGADVEMTADAVPGVTFKGIVESISDATGAAFSMIPQDNATGNFVKVEQRIPVRISLKGNKPEDLKRLRAGFNVECEVKY